MSLRHAAGCQELRRASLAASRAVHLCTVCTGPLGSPWRTNPSPAHPPPLSVGESSVFPRSDVPTFSFPSESSQPFYLHHYHNWFWNANRLFNYVPQQRDPAAKAVCLACCAGFRLLRRRGRCLGDPDGCSGWRGTCSKRWMCSMAALTELLGKDASHVVVDLAWRCSIPCPTGVGLWAGPPKPPRPPCQQLVLLSALTVAGALRGPAAGCVHWHRELGHLTFGD